jgi:hypothetical protein
MLFIVLLMILFSVSEFRLEFWNSTSHSSFPVTIYVPYSLHSGVCYKWKDFSPLKHLTGARPNPVWEAVWSSGTQIETEAEWGSYGTQSRSGSELGFPDHLLISTSTSRSHWASAWPGYPWPGGYQVLGICTKQVRQNQT